MWFHLCPAHRHTQTVHSGSTDIFSTDISRQGNCSGLAFNPSCPFAKWTYTPKTFPAVPCSGLRSGCLGVKVVLFVIELITQKLHKGIFLVSKEEEEKYFSTSCCSPVGLLWHIQTSRSIRRWGESTCPVTVSALGSQAYAGNSTMQCSSVKHLRPEDPDSFFLVE